MFGVMNFSSPPYLLGDTFLRSAYVVYDLANNQIGIAPTDFNSTDSNIVPFPSMSAPIPDATTAPGQSAATAKPSVTTPAFSAQAGFTNSAATPGSGSGSKNAATSMRRADFAQMAVIGVVMALTMAGSGLFLLF